MRPSEEESSYKPPSRKMPMREDFCARESWSFHMIGMGKIKSMKSVSMFVAAAEMK